MSARANRRRKLKAERHLKRYWLGRTVRGLKLLRANAKFLETTKGLYYTLDEDRRPVAATMLEYLEWLNQQEGYVRSGGATLHVASVVFGDLWLSTIFLGLDHGFGVTRWTHDRREDGYAPVLWETMLFVMPEQMAVDRIQERYVTHEGALAGHAFLLPFVRSFAALRQMGKLVGR